MEILITFVLGVFLGVISTVFTVDANQTVKMLNETCSVNKGIESVKLDVTEFRIVCKDGARFNIKR